MGNNQRGHGNTFGDPNGGSVARAATYFAQWLLQGNTTAGAWFTGDGPKTDGFNDVVHKSLDKVKF
jgi:hypothetical protein